MISNLFQEKLLAFKALVESTDAEFVAMVDRYKALQFKEG